MSEEIKELLQSFLAPISVHWMPRSRR